MNKYLKFTVIFLAILIFILLSITIVTIIHKYKNGNSQIDQVIKLEELIGEEFVILSFQVSNEKLYLDIENKKSKSRFIKVYNLNNGIQIGEILLKESENYD
tara:strand:+ start:379 stop:684 length:306 start_codon:yes stop_codon:yes gene_type:complete